MPAAAAPFVALVVGAIAGALMRIPLLSLGYRLPEERALPRPSGWWVVPVTAAVTGAVWWAIAPDHPIVVPAVYVLTVWTMVPLAFVDLDVHRLPDAIQLPAYPALITLLLVCSLAEGTWSPFVRALVAGLVLWLVFFILGILPGGGIGFGDVKLAGLLGMLLGWLSWTHVLHGTVATFLIGGVVAVLVMSFAGKGRRDEFAYGPSMLLGAVVALIAPRALQLLGW